jgi:hypothetical protein
MQSRGSGGKMVKCINWVLVKALNKLLLHVPTRIRTGVFAPITENILLMTQVNQNFKELQYNISKNMF